MLGDGDIAFLEFLIDQGSVPEDLLLIQVVYQKGFGVFDVAPGLRVGEAVRVEADERIYNRP